MKTLLSDFFHLLFPNHNMTVLQQVLLLVGLFILGIFLATIGI